MIREFCIFFLIGIVYSKSDFYLTRGKDVSQLSESQIPPFLGTREMHEGDKTAKDVNAEVNFFGEENEIKQNIRIHYSGVITFDKSELMNECGKKPGNGGREFIAAYWLPNTKGEVYVFQEKRYESNSDDNKPDNIKKNAVDLAADINNAYVTNGRIKPYPGIIDPSMIKCAIFITWFKMSFRPESGKDRDRSPAPNSFQAVLINVDGLKIDDKNKKSKQSFVSLVYPLLSVDNHVVLKDANDVTHVRCPDQDAVVGLNPANVVSKFDMNSFLKHIEDMDVYTNQHNFVKLGGHTFSLKCGVEKQPLPPNLNCGGPEKDEDCDELARRNSENLPTEYRGEPLMPISNNFCKYRSDGLFRYPLFCNRFIHCVGYDARFKTCPKGTHFNEKISNCDWALYRECGIPSISNVTGVALTTSFPIHNNVCRNKKEGRYPHSTDCTRYIQCSNARSISMPCAHNLVFKVTGEGTGKCDFRRNVDCGTRNPGIVTKRPNHHRH